MFHDFKYDPKTSITGASDEWAYDHLGIFSWTTEFWSPIRGGDHRLQVHRLVRRPPGRGRPPPAALERRRPRREGLRRLVPVRPPAARPGRARRLGLLPHLDERAAVAHGRGGRAAQRVGRRAPARVTAPRGAVVHGRPARRRRVAGAARRREHRLAADQRQQEGARAQGGATRRGGDRDPRRRVARARRRAPGARPARGPRPPGRCSRCSTAASTRPTTGPRPSGSSTRRPARRSASPPATPAPAPPAPSSPSHDPPRPASRLSDSGRSERVPTNGGEG